MAAVSAWFESIYSHTPDGYSSGAFKYALTCKMIKSDLGIYLTSVTLCLLFSFLTGSWQNATVCHSALDTSGKCTDSNY
jgi:hypothetical protein